MSAAVSKGRWNAVLRLAPWLNFALYYFGWFACILGPAWGYPWSGTLIAMVLIACHLALARRWREEVVLLLCSAVIGTVVDAVQIAIGTLYFPIGSVVAWLPPPWMIVLWAQFAGTLHFSMGWLKGRPGLACFFGALGGPLAFLAGRRLGVVEFHPQVWPSLLSIGIVWALAMPLLLAMAARQDGTEGVGEYRVGSALRR